MTIFRPKKPLARGVLIALEGIDGGGKSTQLAKVERYLSDTGYEVVVFREPTDGPWGRRIREIARRGREGVTPQEEAELFLQDRREDVEHNIRPALEQKKIVLLDRYYYSNMAYQGALGLDPEEIRRANESFAPRPDLAILLRVSPQVALARLTKGRKGKVDPAYEQEAYLVRVQEIFDGLRGPHVCRLDAEKALEKVTIEILEVIERLLKRIRED